MNAQIQNYVFTIIEDNQVPLAGNFETSRISPVAAVVALGLILLTILAYALWISNHFDRVKVLSGGSRAVNAGYFFHPVKLLRKETELEYSLVNISENADRNIA